MAYCSKCGKELEHNKTICKECGENNSTPNSDNKNKPSIIVIATIILAAIIFIFLGIITIPMNEPSITVFMFGAAAFMFLLIFILYGKNGFIYNCNNNSTNSILKSNGEVFDGFIKNYDDMNGIIRYVHPNVPRIFGGYGTYIYIDFRRYENDIKYGIYFTCVYNYGGSSEREKWFFVKQLIFKTDTNRYIFNVEPKRKHDISRFGQKYYILYSETTCFPFLYEKNIKMFEDIATTTNLRIRLVGENYCEDKYFNGKARKYIVDAYNAYIKNPDCVSYIIDDN